MVDHPATQSAAAINHLRISHLRLVQTLEAVGSLRKAARQLHITQPTASAMLKEVERALGRTLFDRTRQGVTANGRGRSAIARMHALLGELDMLSEEMSARDSLPVLRVGCLYHAFFGRLQNYLREVLPTTDCRIDVVDGPVPELMQRLRQNELDCVIGRMPANALEGFSRDNYFYEPLYEFRTCVLAAPSHPLVGKRRVHLRDLSNYEWILSRSASIPKAAFAAAGLAPPKIRIETSSFVFALRLLGLGDFITSAPLDAALDQQRLGLARILKIDLPQLFTPVVFIAQRSSMLNPQVQLFWKAIGSSTRSK